MAMFDAAVRAFLNWKTTGGVGVAPTVDFWVRYERQSIAPNNACTLMWNCADTLPLQVFAMLQRLGLPLRRQTYAAAAQAMRAELDRALQPETRPRTEKGDGDLIGRAERLARAADGLGVRAAARVLSIDHMKVWRARKIAALSDDGKREARDLGLSDNQVALLSAARQGTASAQILDPRQHASWVSQPKPSDLRTVIVEVRRAPRALLTQANQRAPAPIRLATLTP